MSDTEGVLPGSRAHDLGDAGGPEAPRLPAAAEDRQVEQSLPPAPGGIQLPGGSSTETKETPPNAPSKMQQAATPAGFALSTREERIAAATLSGGLTVLPVSFGDTDGDWVTVRSENPFEVLYLDSRKADRITPEIVGRHRGLLERFWQEKLKSMSQGAARVAVLKKYGGEHESERLIRSYPELIGRAFHRLSTISGIEEAYREIVTRQEKVVFARIDEKLSDFLVDAVLQPQETRALFEFADREGVAREVVAAHVQDWIRAAGLVSDNDVSGTTLEQQLLSSAWVHPSRKMPAQPMAPPQPRNKRLLLSWPVAAVLIMGMAFFSYWLKPSSQPESVALGTAPPTPTVPITQELPEERATVAPAAAPPALGDSSRLTADRIEKPESSPPPPPLRIEQPRAQPEVSAEDRRAVQGELEGIRGLLSTDPSAALESAQRLDLTLTAHAQEFAGELADLANLRNQIQTAVMEGKLAEEKKRLQEESDARIQEERTKKWEQSLAQIESFSKQGNYSGAKNLADQLLREQDVPESIAIRARKLADEAVSKLQAIFSKAKVKSKTARSSDPPH